MKNLVIRSATLADFDTVARFDAMDDKTYFIKKENKAFLEALIHQKSILLGFIDDKPVSYIRWDFIWPERVPLISWLYVVPELRQQYMGETIFFAALHDIEKLGYDHVLMSACDDRPNIIALFQREGLQQAGNLSFPDGTFEMFFWLKLPFERKSAN